VQGLRKRTSKPDEQHDAIYYREMQGLNLNNALLVSGFTPALQLGESLAELYAHGWHAGN
jgi:hypothetical protein